VSNAEVSESLPGFNFANRPERGGLLLAFGISTTISSGSKDDGNALFLVEDCAGEISANLRFVIWMRDDNKQVGFVAGIRRRIYRAVGGCEDSE